MLTARGSFVYSENLTTFGANIQLINRLIMKTFRTQLIAIIMTISLFTLCGCQQEAPQTEASAENQPWVIDRFDDIKVLRYEVPGFENLPLL